VSKSTPSGAFCQTRKKLRNRYNCEQTNMSRDNNVTVKHERVDRIASCDSVMGSGRKPMTSCHQYVQILDGGPIYLHTRTRRKSDAHSRQLPHSGTYLGKILLIPCDGLQKHRDLGLALALIFAFGTLVSHITLNQLAHSLTTLGTLSSFVLSIALRICRPGTRQRDHVLGQARGWCMFCMFSIFRVRQEEC
jgi:hypothetical protein